MPCLQLQKHQRHSALLQSHHPAGQLLGNMKHPPPPGAPLVAKSSTSPPQQHPPAVLQFLEIFEITSRLTLTLGRHPSHSLSSPPHQVCYVLVVYTLPMLTPDPAPTDPIWHFGCCSYLLAAFSPVAADVECCKRQDSNPVPAYWRCIRTIHVCCGVV